MYCPRLDHFRRIMPDGKIGLCGHMTGIKSFANLNDLESSDWLHETKSKMNFGCWPDECVKCKEEEARGEKSIRLHAQDRHEILKHFKDDYLIVGGILDNICNAACMFCSENLSTKIGSLKHGANYRLTDNSAVFNNIPQDRIIELDINGGEPSNSPNYAYLLTDPPPNVKIIRINTNASKYIREIESLIDKGIKVIVTISLDGVEDLYEYVRWPLNWKRFNAVIDRYRSLREQNKLLSLDFWTTISAYNVMDINNIRNFATDKGIEISMGRLNDPWQLDVKYTNPLTLPAKGSLDGVAIAEDNTIEIKKYIDEQDKLRGTRFEDCYNWTH